MSITDTTINAVKDAIYKKLSYSSQDYNAIIADIIKQFTGRDIINGSVSTTSLTTKWDNISEADIMFIFMSLLAAHKDILNYMLDYRIQETYMSTAKERQSIVRIANSFGYKIPSFKAARALMTVNSVGLEGGSFIVNSFSTFIDDNGVSWTYIGEDTEIVSGDTIELFQGAPSELNTTLSNFSTGSLEHIITDQNVAIGNNYSALGCSKLYVIAGEEIYFTEVDNIYSYTGSDDYVYELRVDTAGIVYIKLPRTIDFSSIENEVAVFKYIVTSGADISTASGITASLVDSVSSISYDVELVLTSSADFTAGSNEYSVDQIREDFKHYYASAASLITIYDYKNYILNIQRVVPDIEKCLVVDIQDDTAGGTGSGMDALEIGIYVLKTDNTLLGTDEATLLADLNTHKMSGIALFINDDNKTNAIEGVDIYVDITGTVTNEIETLVSEYVSLKSFGETVTAIELYNMLKENGYDFYNKISVGVVESPIDTEVILQYYQYPVCPVDSAHIVEA
jgi:hypothetical protein